MLVSARAPHPRSIHRRCWRGRYLCIVPKQRLGQGAGLMLKGASSWRYIRPALLGVGWVKGECTVVGGDLDLGEVHDGFGNGGGFDCDRMRCGKTTYVDDGDGLFGKERSLIDRRDGGIDRSGKHDRDSPGAVHLH